MSEESGIVISYVAEDDKRRKDHPKILHDIHKLDCD